MILVYATMVVLLYQQVVPDRELPGGTLPGVGHRGDPDCGEVRRYHRNPAVLALLVGRPIPATKVLGMADDVRLGCASRPSFPRRSTPGRPSISASLVTGSGDRSASRDLRRSIR